MERIEAYHILHDMWKDANEKQREAIDIAQNDIEFVDLMPEEIVSNFNYGVKTKADNIRNMDDVELSWLLMEFRFDAYGKATGNESELPDTQKGMLAWLRQPCEKVAVSIMENATAAKGE